ncbi:hypothetical protein BTVI_153614 [Pitangus sulphuratus]|nr:hypothetical protein BTVI_153614 [Pitangus sulphuratus]
MCSASQKVIAPNLEHQFLWKYPSRDLTLNAGLRLAKVDVLHPHLDNFTEYELEEKLVGGGKMGTKDTSGDVGDQSDSSTESLEQPLGDLNNTQALQSEKRIHIAAIQRNIKLLDDMAKEKELVVQKTRQKLDACRLLIKMLAKQLDRVDMEIEREEEAGNV